MISGILTLEETSQGVHFAAGPHAGACAVGELTGAAVRIELSFFLQLAQECTAKRSNVGRRLSDWMAR